jgi:cytochrome oxidase Cu insertion factor (SCO1/SenC/PrrC family)
MIEGSNVFSQVSYKTLTEFPAFKLKNSGNKIFTSTEVLKKNRPTVVVYFSPTCHHCQAQALDITGNMKLFKDVQFLFVTSYPEADTKSFLDEYAIEKFSNIRFGYDTAFAMGSFFMLKSLPGLFIYNKEGKFVRDFDTNLRPEMLKEALISIEK